MRVTANTVRAFAFLQREPEDIGIVVNTATTVALPLKGHAPTVEEISLLESVDIRIVGEGEVTVVGVPIGTGEYVLDRALEVVRDIGADRLARCLANIPDKQAAVLIAIESLGQRTSYLEGSEHGALPRSMQKGRQWGAVSVRKNPRATRSSGGTVIFPGGMPGESAEFEPSPASPNTPFHGRGKVRATVDRSEANICLRWKQGKDATESCSRPHGPIRRPSEEGAP